MLLGTAELEFEAACGRFETARLELETAYLKFGTACGEFGN